jgi:hypothetical protein
MNLGEQYAAAVLPDRWRVCGVDLMPFALGHLLALQRLGSPFVVVGEPGPVDLTLALYVCSRKPSDIFARWHRDIPWGWKMRGRKIAFQAALRPSRFLDSCMGFAGYVDANSIGPKLWIERGRKDVKTITAPEMLSMHRRMMLCGFSESEAWDMPFVRVRWEQAASAEVDGVASFFTDRDERLCEVNTRN